jgi:peptide/nickel transport system substrate-binding protein
MGRTVCLVITVLVVLSFLLACAQPAPTAAPTKPGAPVAATTAPAPAATSAPAAATSAPAAATKPAAAAPTGATAPTATPATQVKRGGTLKYGAPVTYPTLDPHLASATSPPGYWLLFDSLIDLPMVKKDPPTWEVGPALATSWEVTDPKTIVFKLRQGVKFHDGTAFNAQMAKWNLDRAATNQKSYQRAYYGSVDSIEVVDDNTIKFKLKTPSGGLLNQLWGLRSMMVSKDALEKLGEDEFGRKPVGTGPMTLAEWARDDHLTLKNWGQHWQKGVDGKSLPYVDQVDLPYRPEATVLMLELRTGDLDIADSLEAKDVATVQSNPNLTVELNYPAGLDQFVFGMNGEKGPFVDNKKLRQAVQHAVDRAAMAKALGFGLAKAQDYPHIRDGMLGFSDTLPKYPFDAVKAKQLVAEAGYPNGLDIGLELINRSTDIRMAEVVKSMWDSVGIRTRVDMLDRTAWLEKMKGTDFDTGFWRGTPPLDTDGLTTNFTCGAPSNYPHYCNKDFDACLAEGRASYKNEERDKTYRRCLAILMEDAYVGQGFRLPMIWGMNKRVQDFTTQWNVSQLRTIWLK